MFRRADAAGMLCIGGQEDGTELLQGPRHSDVLHVVQIFCLNIDTHAEKAVSSAFGRDAERHRWLLPSSDSSSRPIFGLKQPSHAVTHFLPLSSLRPRKTPLPPLAMSEYTPPGVLFSGSVET
jgi:hypothetical protein